MGTIVTARLWEDQSKPPRGAGRTPVPLQHPPKMPLLEGVPSLRERHSGCGCRAGPRGAVPASWGPGLHQGTAQTMAQGEGLLEFVSLVHSRGPAPTCPGWLRLLRWALHWEMMPKKP